MTTDAAPRILIQVVSANADPYWRARCDAHGCRWTSGTLPFPDPDAALHCLALHRVLCKGTRP